MLTNMYYPRNTRSQELLRHIHVVYAPNTLTDSVVYSTVRLDAQRRRQHLKLLKKRRVLKLI